MSVEPGVLYEWPTHVPLPEGYPPADPLVDAAAWQRGRGGFVPPLITRDVSEEKVQRREALKIRDLLCRFSVDPNQWETVRRRLANDYLSIPAYTINHTLLWQRRREEAMRGRREMLRGSVARCGGVAGSGKSVAMLFLAWRDFLAGQRCGFNRLMGLSGKWRRFGPWNYVPDALVWDRNRKTYPPGIPVFVDDPLDLPDSENAALMDVATMHMANVAITERDQGQRFYIAKVLETRLPEALFTDIFFTPRDLQVPDCYGLLQRKEKDDTDRFSFTGFLLVVATRLDIGGALGVDGNVLADEIRRMKREAHARLFRGRGKSQLVADIDLLLAENPVAAVSNLFTRSKQKAWISRVMSSWRGYNEQAVERMAEHLWQAINSSGFELKREKSVTGSSKVALFDPDGEPIAWGGNVPDAETCRWICDHLRTALHEPDRTNMEERRESVRRVHRRIRGRDPATAAPVIAS